MKPSELYSSLVEAGKLSFDEEQGNLLATLDGLGKSLESSSRSWFGRKKVKGLYIKGEVGRGKTQMMDIFFETLDIEKKKSNGDKGNGEKL